MIKTLLKYGLILVLALSMGKVKAQQYTEYDLKAAYIYNFSKFVNWPNYAFEDESANFKIVVYGSSPVTNILNKVLKQRTIRGRHISIKVIYKECNKSSEYSDQTKLIGTWSKSFKRSVALTFRKV